MARKGESIYKRKDGRYEARYIKGYNIQNKAIYGYVYAKTYTTVKKKRQEAISNLKKTVVKHSNDVVNSFIDMWLLRKKIEVKESTYSNYYGVIEKHIRPYFKDYKIKELSEEIISNFILSKVNEKLSSKTIKDIGIILKQLLSFMNLDIKVSTPKVSKNEIKILKPEDKAIIINYIKEHPSRDTFGMLLALFMGFRIGEVCALKVKYIDLENKKIYVKHTVERVKDFESNTKKTKLIIDEPKTDKGKRNVPIPSDVMDFIAEMKKQYSDENNFIVTDKTKLVDPRGYYYRYKKILKKLGFGNYDFHTLRHTFATDCVNVGCDAKTLMELLGHADVKISLDVYVHPSEKLKASYVNKLTF